MAERFLKDFENRKERLNVKQLEVELLESAEVAIVWIIDFAEKNNIIVPRIENLQMLIRRVNNLLEELSSEYMESRISDDSYHESKTDEKKHLFRTDDKGTEPSQRFCYLFG